jgi:hypothetical protein
MAMTWHNQSAAANRRLTVKSDDVRNSSSIASPARELSAAVAELGRYTAMDAFFPPKRDFVAATLFPVTRDVVLRATRDALGGRRTATVASVHSARWRLPRQEYNPHRMGVDIWSIGTKRTVFFANLMDGWLTLQTMVVERIGCEAVAFRVSDRDANYPIVELTIYPHSRQPRIIRAMRDDPHWQFYVSGEPLSFEEPGYYKKRRIRDRFTPSILNSYLQKLGWSIADGSIWKPTSVVIRVRS